MRGVFLVCRSVVLMSVNDPEFIAGRQSYVRGIWCAGLEPSTIAATAVRRRDRQGSRRVLAV